MTISKNQSKDKLKFRIWALSPLDYVLFAILLFAIVFVFIINFKPEGGDVAKIVSGQTTYKYDLSKDQEFDIEGEIGSTHIVIKDKKIWFESAPCKDKICIHMGKLRTQADWAACLPNKVFVSIEQKNSESEIDSIVY